MDTTALCEDVTFLAVDDTETIRQVIVAIIRNLGAKKVLQARDGQEAWNTLTKRRIDIIICDWDMPNMNGLEFLQKVRKSTHHANTPVIMLTASTEQSRVKMAITSGASDYLAKPFKPKDLEYRIIKQIARIRKQIDSGG